MALPSAEQKIPSIKQPINPSKIGTETAQPDESVIANEIVMPQQGRSNVLQSRQRHLPPPAANEVLIRVEAAGVSFAEVQMLRGRYFNQPSFPFVPGYDLAGIIADVGRNVTEFSVGQRVAGLTETGGWADHVVLPSKKLVPVPEDVDPVEAVAVITNGVTAWQMLHRVVEVATGQTVLVHGASGGVGTVLTQLARLSDIRVLGTASASKHNAVQELGATPIDYRNEDVPARVAELAPDGVDAVFDHLGGSRIVDSWGMLGPGGTLVSYGVAAALDASGHRLKPFAPLLARLLVWNTLPNGRRATFYYVQRWPKLFNHDLKQMFELLADGDLTVHVDRRFPLTEASETLELLDSGGATGKVVLTPDTYSE